MKSSVYQETEKNGQNSTVIIGQVAFGAQGNALTDVAFQNVKVWVPPL